MTQPKPAGNGDAETSHLGRLAQRTGYQHSRFIPYPNDK